MLKFYLLGVIVTFICWFFVLVYAIFKGKDAKFISKGIWYMFTYSLMSWFGFVILVLGFLYANFGKGKENE